MSSTNALRHRRAEAELIAEEAEAEKKRLARNEQARLRRAAAREGARAKSAADEKEKENVAPKPILHGGYDPVHDMNEQLKRGEDVPAAAHGQFEHASRCAICHNLLQMAYFMLQFVTICYCLQSVFRHSCPCRSE
jgi:hypothetical protein